MYGYLFLLLFFLIIISLIRGSFLIISKIWPFILIYLLIRYIFKQLFSSNHKTKSNSVNKSEKEDPNVIDVDYEEVE